MIIQTLCPGQRVQRIGLNGDVSIKAIAERLASLIYLLGNRHYPIVIVIGREKRIETSEEIKEALRVELNNLGVVNQVIIGVSDRIIENWILADWDSFKKNPTLQFQDVLILSRGKKVKDKSKGLQHLIMKQPMALSFS